MTTEEATNIINSWAESKYKPTHDAACMALAALRAQQEAEKSDPLTPCDLCVYNLPSSGDGKPCCMCPAAGK